MAPATRIVSLLPAATDIVAALGLGDRLVGRTFECDWPADLVATVPVVATSTLDPDHLDQREISAAVAGQQHQGSGLYRLDADLLRELRPELILTQELCEVCAVSYADARAAARQLDGDVRVVSLEPTDLDGILANIGLVAELTDVDAGPVVAGLQARLDAVADAVAGLDRPRVAFLEWLDPLWPAGHWVPEQVAVAGGDEVLGSLGEHTTPVRWQTVVEAAPDVLLLGPCGLPPERTRRDAAALRALPGWQDLPAVADGRVWILDGPALFNRPGPRVVRGAEVLARVLHDVPVPGAAPVTAAEASLLHHRG